MPVFNTIIIDGEVEVRSRLADFDLTFDQIIAIAEAARYWATNASPLMPQNAPGTLAYIFGVEELRRNLIDDQWIVDRTCGVEAVLNRELNIRIGYQNVDKSCDPLFPPNPRSPKGNAAENMSGPTLFQHAGIDAGPLTAVRQDGVPTYYVMVGEDGSAELSNPIIKSGSFVGFNERIFVSQPNEDWEEEIDPETGPVEDFDIQVTLKDEA